MLACSKKKERKKKKKDGGTGFMEQLGAIFKATYVTFAAFSTFGNGISLKSGGICD